MPHAPHAITDDERAEAWRDALTLFEESLAFSEEAYAHWAWAVTVRKERGDRAALACSSIFAALR